ncbi:MAG: alanine dehydrogenase [Bacteroidales bacterium]
MEEGLSNIRFSAESQMLPREEMLEVKNRKSNLTIGIPRETSPTENRIALVPDAIKLLVANGHRVFVEENAGINAHFTDFEFSEAGAELVKDRSAVFGSDIVLKISPPDRSEIEMIGRQKSLFSVLQLPTRDKDYFLQLSAKRTTALAFEQIQDRTGSLPLKRSMSEIIGNAAILVAAEYLCHPSYGKGVMLGGFPGVIPTEIVIIGAGTVAEYAIRAATGMGASVKVFDNSMYKLRALQHKLGMRLYTSILQPHLIEQALRTADVLIGAKHSSNGFSPCFVTSDIIRNMKPGSVVIDVSIDQGGCFETSEPTTHLNPVYQHHGITHYCVPNIASKVPRTAAISFSNFFGPLLLEIGEAGSLENLLRFNLPLRRGVYQFNGKVTNQQISNKFDLPFQHIDLLMAAFF